jgi:hypothetical protein
LIQIKSINSYHKTVRRELQSRGNKQMNLWSRMDLIALTSERFLGNYYDFIFDDDGGWMIKLFYLIKVNVALWFGWESTSIRNSQFAIRN